MGNTLQSKNKVNGSKNGKGVPTWDVAAFFPVQGDWTEEEYLELERNFGNRMVELVDGCLEVLPMPSLRHQRIVKWLSRKLDDYAMPQGLGETQTAPLPVRLFPGQIREPDIVFFEAKRIRDIDKLPLDGAELVMEVPSPGKMNRNRDIVIKRRAYAKARIREYWIVDPQKSTITVLTLAGKTYKVFGVFQKGDEATSKLLKGFKVAVSDVFAAGEAK